MRPPKCPLVGHPIQDRALWRKSIEPPFLLASFDPPSETFSQGWLGLVYPTANTDKHGRLKCSHQLTVRDRAGVLALEVSWMAVFAGG